MECIKPLPESVRSSVRSGFIISSLTTIVEELIYNSLDAGAKKVSVSVGISNGYVKVEDDGTGISRDGLILLGERYATSKSHQSHTGDNCAGSFGFRGEVLCSIADISLMEIITRMRGRPNGYRKVMKGRNCLYLGIDDRQDVGTTVIVRDLFYNQPVRRRQMQSSDKKVLHSVRECAVRVSLMQTKVSFKVVDIESENELLCTHASSSPLSLLCTNFGIEASSLLELSTSNGFLELTGHVSAPSSSFASKAIQYIYVNSRFVVKGPIHKVLNRLADMCWDQVRADKGGKRSHPYAVPSYCLNLACPRSSYDIIFESSGTSAEFKDLALVLEFIEKSVSSLWNKKNKTGSSSYCDPDQIQKDGMGDVIEDMPTSGEGWWLKTCETSTKRRRTQSTENEEAFLSKSLHCEDIHADTLEFSVWHSSSDHSENPREKSIEYRFPETKKEFTDYMDLSRAVHVSPSNCMSSAKNKIDGKLFSPAKGRVSLNEDLLEYDVMRTDDTSKDVSLSDSPWNNETRGSDPGSGDNEAGNWWSFRCRRDFDGNYNDHSQLHVQSQSWDNLVQAPLVQDKKCTLLIDTFEDKKRCWNSVGGRDVDGLSLHLDAFERAQCQDEVTDSWLLPKHNTESPIWKDSNMNSLEYSLLSCRGSFDIQKTPESVSEQVRVFTSPFFSPDSDHASASEYPCLNVKDWDVDRLVQDVNVQQTSIVKNSLSFDGCDNGDDELYPDNLGNRCMDEDSFSMSSLSSTVLLGVDYVGMRKRIWESHAHGCSSDDIRSVRYHVPSSPGAYFPLNNMQQRDSSVCWTPINKVAEMDLRRCQALGQLDIARGNLRSKSHINSPDNLHSVSIDDILAGDIVAPYPNYESNTHVNESPGWRVSSSSAGRSSEIGLPSYKSFESNRVPLEQFEITSLSTRKRSHSAPPIYRGKRSFLSASDCLISASKDVAQQAASHICYVSGKAELDYSHGMRSLGNEHQQHDEMGSAGNSNFCIEQKAKETSNITEASGWTHDFKINAASFGPGSFKKVKELESCRVKWREGCPDTTVKDLMNCQSVRDRMDELKDGKKIMDIQTLNFGGDSVVPKSVNRNCLETAKVLLQVDNKFIPVVARGTLAVIDQHAADERIQLEDMRRKVLSGELKSITYLEEEKDLVLPEIAYQLLCNYSENIQCWGWICNIFCQDSGSFAKNLNLLNEQVPHLRLLAVPCVLGVNLSDDDLLEYLEQLADTDGSSTIPPAVVRVLNYKACRGAIMFGDKLLPSECSLIVEELKQTSLCFQCAHGRPTTVPLVNLKALRRGIMQLGSSHEVSEIVWHGLRRKDISIGRAKQRLVIARG